MSTFKNTTGFPSSFPEYKDEEGGMTLYIKAGPDGQQVGDCPFAQYVRMVLAAKGLAYDVRPCVQETKPKWLVEYYNGKMPALRHRRECYVESDTIAAYLDFFFPTIKLTAAADEAATAATDGLFGAVAQYLKHTPDGDAAEQPKREHLQAALAKLEAHLATNTTGPYLLGESLALNDCKLAPQLYILFTGMQVFKKTTEWEIATDYPHVQAYMNVMEKDPSFQATVYPKEVMEWGWTKARENAAAAAAAAAASQQ